MKNQSYGTLMIGNSRLHWGLFEDNNLIQVYHTPHFICPQLLLEIPLYIASVVPSQTDFWLKNNNNHLITLSDIPLKNIYSTIGIDRVLALWGAINQYGFPCLVIDAGTALTFTGADEQPSLVGGAILPGLGLQLKTLTVETAALPKVSLTEDLPQLWAKNTSDAIISGVVYTLLSGIVYFINNWLTQFNHSKIIITGGDRLILLNYLQLFNLPINNLIINDENLIFWGMKNIVYN